VLATLRFGLVSNASLALSAGGPDLAVTCFHFDPVQCARWWTIKNSARCCIEGAFMARAFQSLLSARVVNRAAQVRTLLSVSVVCAVCGANEDCGVALCRIAKVQAAVWSKCLGAFDVRSG